MSWTELLYVSGIRVRLYIPVFTSGTLVFVATAQEMIPFDHLVLVTRETRIPGSYGNVTIGETADFHLRALKRQQMKHLLSLSVKEAHLLDVSLGHRGRTSDLAHISVGYRDALREHRQGWEGWGWRGMPSLYSP